MPTLIRIAGITISLVVLFTIAALASDPDRPDPIALGLSLNHNSDVLVIACDVLSFQVDRRISPDPDPTKLEDLWQNAMDEIRLLCSKANFLRSTRVIKIICYRPKSPNLSFSCEIDSDSLLLIGLRVDFPPSERRER
jgi:hypothetical protein